MACSQRDFLQKGEQEVKWCEEVQQVQIHGCRNVPSSCAVLTGKLMAFIAKDNG